MKVAIYARVSTSEQANEGWSIPEQIDRLSKYCESQRWDIYDTYVDAGFTGTNLKRPALQRLISDIDQIDKVVVWKLDRLSRSQRDTLTLIEDIFIPNNTDLVSMNESFDTSTSFGRFMIGILSSFAQLEKNQISERMLMGKSARAKEGKWHGGTAPIGYIYTDGELIVDEPFRKIIVEIFERYVSNEPIRSIERDFRSRGIKTPYGSLFTSKIIRYALSNRVYIGQIRHRDEWIDSDHERIIDSDTFSKANLRLSVSHNEFVQSGIKTGIYANSTLLGGLIFCAHCGARYGKANSGNKRYGYTTVYKCYSRHKKVKSMIKDPDCKNKTWRIPDLDDLIINEIRKLTFEDVTKKKDDLPLLEDRLKKVSSQIERFMTLYSLGRYEVSDLDRYVLPLEEEKRELELKIKKAAEATSQNEMLSLLEGVAETFDHGSFSEKRAVIESLIDHIEISGENIQIFWTFS